jgi:Ala-tRNA(Pro) deacylase
MPMHQLLELLDEQQVPYATIRQPTVSALDSRGSAGAPGRAVAKTIPVKLDGQLALAVLAASDRLELKRLRVAAGVRHVELASEREVQTRCPGSGVGALPPFGQLCGLPVRVAERLAESKEIAFAAGAPTKLIRMAYRDFERVLVTPRVADFSFPEGMTEASAGCR